MYKYILIVAALLALPQTNRASSPNSHSGKRIKKERSPMLKQGFLNLEDEMFWHPRPDLSPATGRLLDESFTGFALDAPQGNVDIRSRDALPLIGISIATYAQLPDWSFQYNVILVASETDRFRSYIGMAAFPERPTVRRSPSPKPLPEEVQGTIAENAIIEARHRLNLPWEPGTYRMTLLSRDWVSNSVHVRLVDGKAPSTARASTAQPLPGNGIALTVSGKGKTALLKAGFKVRAWRELLARDTVPITFVVTGHREPMPYTKEIAASPRWVNEPGLPEHATGEIQVTFGQLAPPAPADTYYVYAFAGEELSNPVQVLVGKE